MEPQQPQQQPQQPDPSQQPANPDPMVWQEDTPVEQAAAEQTFHVARPINPAAPVVPEDIQKHHQESKAKYPQLNLTPGEYVIRSIPRHPIGLLSIWAGVLVVVMAIIGITYMMTSSSASLGLQLDNSMKGLVYFAAFFLAVLTTIGGMIASYVYENNRFFLTNESVIQEIQISLFAKREQTVSLGNVEDASYSQDGILPMLFNFGKIRLSTQGDETTYRFNYVANPKSHIAALNNAVESFKMGRPVYLDDDD